MRKREKSRRRGFTLVELMVVVVILGILATVAITAFGSRVSKARKETTKTIISKIGQQIELFKLDNNRYPERLEDLLHRPSYVDPAKWPADGYLKKEEEIQDGWGNDLIYRRPGTNASYDLISYGEDGQPGGTLDAEDIWNHDKAR